MNHIFEKSSFIIMLPLLLLSMLLGGCATKPIQDTPQVSSLRSEMRVLGARNWIVIAEAAFPIQTRQGIKVISIDDEVPSILESIENIIEETYHVTPRIYLTSEISNVEYDYAPGIKNYLKQLERALHGRSALRLDHGMLLEMVKGASKDYQVLVIKSRTALPYSSVFIELGSGYWGTEAESILRDKMEKKLTPVDSPITAGAATPAGLPPASPTVAP